MEIISRKQAMAQNLNKYFTGFPCRNGHVAERYVQSSTCQLCIRPESPNKTINPVAQQRSDDLHKLREMRLDDKNERNRRIKVRESLTKIRTMCPYVSIGILRNFAYLVTAMRHPDVAFGDVACTTIAPTSVTGSVGRYTLMIDPQDHRTIISRAIELMNPVRASDEDLRQARERATSDDAMIGRRFPEGDPR